MKKFFLALFIFCCLGNISHAQLEDGTLIFLEQNKWIVEQYTDSPTSHVAIVLNEDGKSYVYEATPPNVRRMTLDEYHSHIAALNAERKVKIRMYIFLPKKSYDKSTIAKMKKFVDGELGRKYSIKGFLRKRPVSGTHCSQFVASVLNVGGRFNFKKPYTITPVTLLALITPEYKDGVQIRFEETKPEETSWNQEWLNLRINLHRHSWMLVW